MVKHIVFFRFKEHAAGQTKQQNMLDVKQRLEALGGLPGVVKIEVGFDVLEGDASCDVALYSEFDDQVALDGYQQNPDHMAVKELLGEVTEERYVVDYSI
ncbi:MAG: Dabb family protein [Proteobacteria bacterium]|jgi:hypothetical protein|nr:Dabb family protein [Pseudomonadota bacterium]